MTKKKLFRFYLQGKILLVFVLAIFCIYYLNVSFEYVSTNSCAKNIVNINWFFEIINLFPIIFLILEGLLDLTDGEIAFKWYEKYRSKPTKGRKNKELIIYLLIFLMLVVISSLLVMKLKQKEKIDCYPQLVKFIYLRIKITFSLLIWALTEIIIKLILLKKGKLKVGIKREGEDEDKSYWDDYYDEDIRKIEKEIEKEKNKRND